MMKPRITLSVSASGTLEIWVNEQGRDLLVEALENLNKSNDHFHLTPEGPLAFDLPVRSRPYRDGDQIFEWGKVLFRPDDWDAEYFPHVLDTP